MVGDFWSINWESRLPVQVLMWKGDSFIVGVVFSRRARELTGEGV